MKRKVTADERVAAQRQKICSDAFQLLYYALLISVLVQQIVFSAPFSQYAVEFVAAIAAASYVLIRNFKLGNDVFGARKSGQKYIILSSFVCGITIVAVNAIFNQNNSDAPTFAIVSAVTFLSAAGTSFILLEIIFFANRRRQRKIAEKLDSDENE